MAEIKHISDTLGACFV